MASAKKSALELIESLPDEASWNDIMYEVYIRQKIEQGLLDVEQGRTVPHEEIKLRLTQRQQHAS